VPIVGEPLGAVDAYGDDRCFVLATFADEPAADGLIALAGELRDAGHPVVETTLARRESVGAEFIRWEVATAALGIMLEVNPFDQPDVAAAKEATESLLAAFRRDGAIRMPLPVVSEPGLAASADPATMGETPPSVAAAVRSLVGSLAAGDYFAVLAYLPPDPAVFVALDQMRTTVRDALGAATTAGIGPRYLHSTGQLHKGGPASGVYLMLSAEPERDLPIPGRAESFGTLVAAQAAGDLAALQARGRRVIRLHAADTATALDRTMRLVAEAVGSPVG
jgi:transaldolase/glucose-6-phosphate isomerase